MATKSAKRTKSALSPLAPFAFCLLSHSLCRFTCSKWNGMAWIYVWTDFQGYFGTTAMVYSKYIYIYRYYTELCQTIYRSMPQKVFEWQKKAILLHIRAIFIGFCMRVCVWLLISCFFLLRSDHLIYLQCALSNYQTWAENDNCACKLRNKNLKLKEPNIGNNNKW